MFNRDYLSELPPEIILKIMSHDIRIRGTLAKTSTCLRNIADDYYLWNQSLEPRYKTSEPGKAKQIFLKCPEKRLPQFLFFGHKEVDIISFLTKALVEEICSGKFCCEVNDVLRGGKKLLLSLKKATDYETIAKILAGTLLFVIALEDAHYDYYVINKAQYMHKQYEELLSRYTVDPNLYYNAEIAFFIKQLGNDLFEKKLIMFNKKAIIEKFPFLSKKPYIALLFDKFFPKEEPLSQNLASDASKRYC